MDSVEIRKTISDRADFLRKLIEDTPIDHSDRYEYEMRLATLTDGISIIKVGAQTEVERHEKKHRVEDAIKAVKSASQEGVIPGGGTALLRCIEAIDALESSGDESLD